MKPLSADNRLTKPGVRALLLVALFISAAGIISLYIFYVEGGHNDDWPLLAGFTAYGNGEVESLSFSPTSGFLATGGSSSDHDVKLWDTRTWKEQVIMGHQGWGVPSLSFSGNSKYLATGGFDRRVIIWDIAANREDAVLGFDYGIVAVAFTTEREEVATLGITDNNHHGSLGPGELVVWGRLKEKWTQRHRQLINPATKIAVMPDSKNIAIGNEDGRLVIINTTNWKETITLKAHTGPVEQLVVSPDGSLLATGSGDIVKLWTGHEIKEMRTVSCGKKVRCLVFAGNRSVVLVGHWDGSIVGWSTITGREVVRHKAHAYAAVKGLAVSPDEKLLAAGLQNGIVKVWELPRIVTRIQMGNK